MAAGTVALASGGMATSGSDYTAPGLPVFFAAGERSMTVTVATLADATVETDETVTLTLGAAIGGGAVSPTRGTATGTISNVASMVAGNDNFTTLQACRRLLQRASSWEMTWAR